MKSWNVDELQAYAELVSLGNPDFIEVKVSSAGWWWAGCDLGMTGQGPGQALRTPGHLVHRLTEKLSLSWSSEQQ